MAPKLKLAMAEEDRELYRFALPDKAPIYADEADKTPSPDQGTLMGPQEPPAKIDLLRRAIQTAKAQDGVLSKLIDASPAAEQRIKDAHGDNQNGRNLLDLRDANVMSDGTATLAEYYQGIVSKLGIETGRVDGQQSLQKDILTRMENQREDLSGVNLDEEMTNLLAYQRAYEAAGRMMSAVDSALDTLINRTGLVGR
jgi:flagellar hook-associated protein FlgK